MGCDTVRSGLVEVAHIAVKLAAVVRQRNENRSAVFYSLNCLQLLLTLRVMPSLVSVNRTQYTAEVSRLLPTRPHGVVTHCQNLIVYEMLNVPINYVPPPPPVAVYPPVARLIVPWSLLC